MSTMTLSQRRERRGRYYTHYIYNKKASNYYMLRN
jgi:hypothetical protein